MPINPNPKSNPHYLWLPLAMLLFSLLALQSTRVLMVLMYPDYFANNSLSSILKAMLFGMRFDVATLTIIGSAFWLWLIIPSQLLQHPILRQLFAGLYGVLLLIILAICFGDVYYFGEVYRHAGNDLINSSNDLGDIGIIIWQSIKLYTALALLYVVLLGYLWWRFIILRVAKHRVRVPTGIIGKVASTLSLLILSVFFWRGMYIHSKPIAVVDAFALQNTALANLAINGSFALMKDINRPKQQPINLLDTASLNKLDDASTPLAQENPALAQILGDDADKLAGLFTWQQQLFKSTPLNLKRKNVVLILLESWSYPFIDALGKRGYNATPFMDKLVAKSQVWDNFYAAGQRSILGVQATFASVPILNNLPSLGFGLERNRISGLGHIARGQGYQTLFMQTSKKRSFYLDGIANLLGFEQIYGKEDFPVIKKYPENSNPPFGWDYDGLMFLHSKIDKMVQQNTDKPFIATLFTGTTHIPFADPGSEFHVRAHNSKTFDGFLNTLRYSDWAIEQFMAAAAKSSWYKDTVFIFLADHVYQASVTDAHSLQDLFHIPLIIYAPDGSLPPARLQNIASQYDLLPTILDFIQAPTPISAFGRSLFDDLTTRQKFAVVSQGDVYGVVSQDGWANFSGYQDLEKNGSEQFKQHDADTYRQQARWRLEHADKNIRANKWLPKFRQN